MKLRYSITALLVCAALNGCTKTDRTDVNTDSRTNASAEDLKRDARQAVATAREYVGDTKDRFVASTEVKLRQLDAKIDALGVKAQTLSADAKAESAKAVDALKEQRAKLGEKFDEVKNASEATWRDVKSGFETALSEVEKACDNLRSKLTNG